MTGKAEQGSKISGITTPGEGERRSSLEKNQEKVKGGFVLSQKEPKEENIEGEKCLDGT